MHSIVITGGTGSFGKAFVSRLLQIKDIRRIAIFSRGEHAQHDMMQSFEQKHRERLRFFIGDVRDRDRLRRAFDGADVVIHAAALKRIEVGENNPAEMVKTNVLGAMNVIEAAQDANVKKVVALSTDKAYQPISPYGHSKAIAESLFIKANNTTRQDDTKFSVTRYGNVAGSAGSVIPTWRNILKSIKAVPVTDPECTRFWMTMDEAVQLVWETINTMKGGETAIPDLPAYRLGDLAKAMGALMLVHGLPAHEKLHECMSADNCSNTARRLSISELRLLLKGIP